MDFYVSFIFRGTMNDIGYDDGKICTSQLIPDKDLLTIFSNIFCVHGCLNQNKTRFRSEPFKGELKKFQKKRTSIYVVLAV